MIKCILFSLALLLGQTCFGQDEIAFDWVQIALGYQFTNTVDVDTDDNLDIYHCGTIENGGNANFSTVDSTSSKSYGYIAKESSNGVHIWGKTITSENTYNSPYFRKIAITNSGDVLCIGEFLGTMDFDPSASVFELTSIGGGNVFVLKLSMDGEFIWAKALTGLTPSYSNSYIYGLDVDDDDNIYLSGAFSGEIDFDPGIDTNGLSSVSTFEDLGGYLLKLNTDGNFQWVESINTDRDDGMYNLAVDHDNNVIATAYFYDSISIQSAYVDTVFTSSWIPTTHELILKYDPNGEVIWVSRVGTSYWFASDVLVDENNDILLAGRFTNGINFTSDAANYIPSNGVGDGFIAKIKSTGDYEWAHNIGGSYSDFATSLAVQENGNILLSINTEDSVYYDSLFITYDYGGYGTVLILGQTGNYIDAIHLSGGEVNINSIVLDGNGGLISAGRCITPDYSLVDFDPNPTSVFVSPEEGQGAFVHKLSLTYYPEISDDIFIYPNPLNGETTIFVEDYDVPMEVEVIDYKGKLVKKFTLSEKLSTIDLQELTVGVHFLRFTTSNDLVVKKIVKI